MRAALVLALVLLAGCSGDRPPADAAAMPAATAATAAPMPPPAVATPVAVPFTWSGHTKEGAWVCMEQDGAGQCPAGQQVAPDGQHVTALAYAGNLTAVDLTMTWQADPTQTGLVLAVHANRTGGPLAVVQGDSPLSIVIDAAGLGLPPDDGLRLMVWPEGKTATSPSLFIDATQQAFTVEGKLWQDGAG